VKATKKGFVKTASLPLRATQSGPGWVDLHLDTGSRTIYVDVFVDCENEDDLGQQLFGRLKRLVLEGIGHYWSRAITQGPDVYNIVTTAHQRDSDSEDLDIYVIMDTEYEPSHNSGIIDASLKYNQGFFGSNISAADQDFKVIAAHEWGHAVLENAEGRLFSWRHKGTTSLTQDTLSSAPVYPTTGEIDLMKYYNGAEPADYDNRVLAADEDVKRLIEFGTLTVYS
jgi:hypothetical protein